MSIITNVLKNSKKDMYAKYVREREENELPSMLRPSYLHMRNLEARRYEKSAKKYRDKAKYHIVDRRTHEIVGRHNDLTRARRARDKLDTLYGSYNHAIIDVEEGKLK